MGHRRPCAGRGIRRQPRLWRTERQTHTGDHARQARRLRTWDRHPPGSMSRLTEYSKSLETLTGTCRVSAAPAAQH